MFFDDEKKRAQIAKWCVGIAAACILIYLAFRHVGEVMGALSYLADITLPLLIGAALALILNVPLRIFERHLFPNTKNKRLAALRRPLGILLSVLLVLGISVGCVVLIIPTLAEAVTVVYHLALDAVNQLAAYEMTLDFSQIPFGEYLAQVEIDWNSILSQLESWAKTLGAAAVDWVLSTVTGLTSTLVDLFIGFIFGIYILVNKSTLRRQLRRLVRVWLPEKWSGPLLYALSVCSNTFQLFIAGQTIEAVILGSLCALGMLLLRLPYAPMIGVLVGVTALIPYVGAFIGTVVGAFIILTVSPMKALIYVVYLLILQQVEGNLIYPKVVGAKLNLPAMWVLAAIAVGGNLAGPLGMLLSVPIAAAAYTLLKEATNRRAKKIKQAKNQDV